MQKPSNYDYLCQHLGHLAAWRAAENIKTFYFPVLAVPKERARGAGGHHYTPEKTREYEKNIAQGAEEAMNDLTMLTGRLGARICFFVDDVNNDLDNLEKALLDGLQKGRVFKNDNQFDYVEKHRICDPLVVPIIIVAILWRKF